MNLGKGTGACQDHVWNIVASKASSRVSDLESIEHDFV